MPNPSNYSKSSPNASGYTAPTKSKSNYKVVNTETGFLLLNTGDYLLLNTGEKLRLHRSQTAASNYVAESTP